MRKGLYVFLAAAIIAAAGCGGSKSVRGTWELIYPETGNGPPVTRNVKVVSDTHFAFGSPAADGGIFAGGGTWELSDSTYTETVRYHTLHWLVGQRLEFKYHIEDDKWYHSGTFDIGGRRFTVNEIWRRVKE